jgi:hypothetical protein
MRVVPYEVRDIEIDALVACGLLDPVGRGDPRAIAAALGNLIDQLPPERWNAPPEGPGLVSLDLTSEFINHLELLGWLPAAALARSLKLDMAEHWEATAENYFTRVPKKRLLEELGDNLKPNTRRQPSTGGTTHRHAPRIRRSFSLASISAART